MSTTPARWSGFKRYLKAEHLAGRRVTVTIARIAVEETHPRPGITMHSPVAYFVGKAKGLVLSPTNQDSLQDLFGDDIAACVGETIALQAISLPVAGRQTQPIRIYPAAAPTTPGTPMGREKDT